MAKTSVRLPKYIIPQRYALTIKPDLEAFTFIGNEIIDIVLDKNVKTLTLHSKDLEITDGWWQVGKTRVDIVKTVYNPKAETATFTFSKSLVKGKGKLHLHFRGIIQDSLRGFYRSQYTNNGAVQRIATTQFEATDARRAFPCFDEPSQKAVFEVTLIIPEHLTAISNTVEAATPHGVEHDPGYKAIKFRPTPKMSTYLLAYMIGDFESVEDKTKDGITIRVFTTPGKKEQAKFSLDVAKRSLEFLNSYFAIPYPLPELDLIAIPDFSSGAMENWGAVTFRESALLVDEEHTAFATKQHVAEVVAHELVHQWFGNLVTMEWWTHLWLNESFASYMSYIVVDNLFPEWHIWTRFVMHDHANALQLDSLENTHPIEVEVHHPNQISEIFDAISYDKGASVLRMLHNYIGPEHFRYGLRYYLKKHSYKNTSSEHLWEAFEKVSKKPIRKFMKNWLTKPGYPLITVVEPRPDKLHISQNRFSLKKSKDKTLWPIPVQFEINKGRSTNLELFSSSSKILSISPEAAYVKANPQETGFYRTLYSPSLLAKLYEPIKNKELSVIDRFGIIRDLFAAVKSNNLPTSAYLEFISAYKNDDSYIVWAEILSGMSSIYNVFSAQPALQKKLARYYREVLKDVAQLVGWNADHKESQSRALLRSAVLTQYGYYGDKDTQETAVKLFKNKNKKLIPPDLRNTVYFLTALTGDKNTMGELQRMYSKSTLQEEQRRVGRALTAFKNKQLFKSSLDFSLSKAVRSQDAPLMIAVAFANAEGRETAWKWLQKNWAILRVRYHDDHLIVWIIKGLNYFSSESSIKEIEKFFKTHPVPAAQRAIKQAIEEIRSNAGWAKRDSGDLANCKLSGL